MIVDVTINGRSNIVQPLKNAYPYTPFFNVMFNHDESQVDYLGYKVLFIMNDGQTYTHTHTHANLIFGFRHFTSSPIKLFRDY